MRNILIIFLFICFGLFKSQETIKVIYETINNPKISFNSQENLSESMKEEFKMKVIQKAQEPKKFTLYYYKGNSFFQRDTDLKNNSSEKQKIEYYRLKNKDGIFLLNDYKVDEFYGYYPMNNVSVEFANDTQTIENFNCKLALYKIGNTISKVWYTEEIPISAGPYNYYKVPGLVLKVESPNFLSYAISISKDCKESDIKKMDSKLKTYEGEELNEKINEGLIKLRNNNQQKIEQMRESLKKKL